MFHLVESKLERVGGRRIVMMWFNMAQRFRTPPPPFFYHGLVDYENFSEK